MTPSPGRGINYRKLLPSISLNGEKNILLAVNIGLHN